MEHLGHTVCDFEQAMTIHRKYWLKIFADKLPLEERSQLFYTMFKDYDLILDAPVNIFWKEIHEALKNHFDCKLVFYEREENAWCKSFKGRCR